MGVVMVPIIDINYLVVVGEDLCSFFHDIVYVMFSFVAMLRRMIETAA